MVASKSTPETIEVYCQIYIHSVFLSSHGRFLAFPQIFLLLQFFHPLTRPVVGFALFGLVLLATSGDVSSQPHPTSSNHSTTNIIKTPLIIMVNTNCLHEGCQRKPMKHGNGYCHLHGDRRKCTYPQCSNFVQSAGMCVQHGSKKKQCSVNECTNNAVRNGVSL
jgi:hypothetical protein